jgi:hypothetical protein
MSSGAKAPIIGCNSFQRIGDDKLIRGKTNGGSWFAFEENIPLSELSRKLGVDESKLSGFNDAEKLRNLTRQMLGKGLLFELARAVDELGGNFVWTPELPGIDNLVTDDAQKLADEVATLRQQTKRLEELGETNEELKEAIRGIQESADRVEGQGNQLTARILLPRAELMNVQLVRSDALDRLEEYNSDQNIAFLLVGAFLGAILGILSNWATNENFVITRFSAVLILVLIALLIGSGVWAWQLRKRAATVKRQMLGGDGAQVE